MLAVLLIVGAGLFFSLALPTVPFVNDGNCDPWYIFGQFYWLTKPAHWFLHMRQVARLPATAPGFVLTSVLHGVAADYAYFYASFTLAILFFYLSALIMLGPSLALAALIVFAFHPLIVANFSATLNAWALTYDLIALYFVCLACKARTSRSLFSWSLASGVAFGVAMNSWLGIAAFGLANYLYLATYILVFRASKLTERVRVLGASSILVIAGVILASIAQGIVDSLFFNGRFWQIFNQYNWIEAVSWSSAHIFWRRDWYAIGGQGGMLVAAFMIACVSVINVVRRKRERGLDDRQKLPFSMSVATIGVTIILLIYNEVGGVFLQNEYYYYYFVPYFVLAMFSAPLFLKESVSVSGISGVLAVAGLATEFVKNKQAGWLLTVPHEAISSGLVAAAAIAIVVPLSIATGWRKNALLYAYAFSIAVMFLVQRPVEFGSGVWDNDPSRAMRDEYVRMREGLAFLNTLPFEQPPLFWIDRSGTPGEAWAYSPSYLACGYNPFPTINPELWSRPGRNFQPGYYVVVVSGRSNIQGLAPKAFASLGLGVRELGAQEISYRSVHYALVAYRVENRIGRR